MCPFQKSISGSNWGRNSGTKFCQFNCHPDVAGGAALVLGRLAAVVAAQGHAVAEPGHIWEEVVNHSVLEAILGLLLLTDGPLSSDNGLEGDHLAGVYDQILGGHAEGHHLLPSSLLALWRNMGS